MRRHAGIFFGLTLLGLDAAVTGIAFYLAHLLRPRIRSSRARRYR